MGCGCNQARQRVAAAAKSGDVTATAKALVDGASLLAKNTQQQAQQRLLMIQQKMAANSLQRQARKTQEPNE